MNTKNQQTDLITEIDYSIRSPAEKVDMNLSKIFQVDPMQTTEVSVIDEKGVVPPPSDTAQEEIKNDVAAVRSNLYSPTQQGSDALNYALELAKSSDSPRAFEVVATLIKTIADVNMQILDAQDRKSKLLSPSKKAEEPAASKVVNNSIVFNGTTADLNKMINNMRSEN